MWRLHNLAISCVVLTSYRVTASFPEQNVSCPAYTMIENMGLVSGDTLLKEVPATDVAECCSACNATAGCGAFTFSSKDKTCRMTTTDNISSHRVAGVTSGKKSNPTPVPFPDYCKPSNGKNCHNVLYFVADGKISFDIDLAYFYFSF